MEGTARPDYKRCVAISTSSSLSEMIPPGALVMLSPVLVGALFGVQVGDAGACQSGSRASRSAWGGEALPGKPLGSTDSPSSEAGQLCVRLAACLQASRGSLSSSPRTGPSCPRPDLDLT